MLIHGETNFVLVQTLYVLDCHRRRDIRPSRLYVSPRSRLGSIGVPRRALGARKNSVGRTRIIRTSVIKIFLKFRRHLGMASRKSIETSNSNSAP